MQLATIIFWASWGAILYTYLLFPLLLALMARRARSPVTTEATACDGCELPRVAIVTAAHNEAAVLRDKLRNTWAIDYPADRFELVIGSDGSVDGTAEILRECGDSRLRAVAFPARRGKPAVLNQLVELTDADILVMSDANTMFAPDAVRRLVAHFVDCSVGCVSGELSLEQDGGVSGEGLYWRYEGWIKRNESRLGFLIGCNGGIYAIRRRLYRPLAASTIVDDFVVSMRVLEEGYRIRFEPEARATEPPAPSAHAEMVRKIRIGAGGFQAIGLTRRLLHPRYGARAFAFWGQKVLRWCVPLFLLAALGANVALASASELYRLLLCLQVAAAMFSGCACGLRAGTRLPRWTRPISYFYLMNFALLCGFVRFLRGSQRVTWDRAAVEVARDRTVR